MGMLMALTHTKPGKDTEREKFSAFSFVSRNENWIFPFPPPQGKNSNFKKFYNFTATTDKKELLTRKMSKRASSF